jgi:hypothetical protein
VPPCVHLAGFRHVQRRFLAGRLPSEVLAAAAITLAVVASERHQDTDYDELLMRGDQVGEPCKAGLGEQRQMIALSPVSSPLGPDHRL